MFHFDKVKLGNLLISFSKALDYIDRSVANHHLRVAIIADEIAKACNLSKEQRVDIFIAASLHDIGVFTLVEKLELTEYDFRNPREHAYRGYLLIKDYKIFSHVANIIQFHHLSWNDGDGQYSDGQEVPIGAHILHLADRIEILINKQFEVLKQKDSIIKAIKPRVNTLFVPQVAEAFLDTANRECFWFDASSQELDDIISDMEILPAAQLDVEDLGQVARLFSHIIDFRSTFTAVHSAGVSAVASLLGQLAGFSSAECRMISISGHLHDVGKITVPTEILEKPSKLTEEEFNIMKSHVYHTYRILNSVKGLETINRWGSFHHERVDGHGYPFKLTSSELPLGSRILAIADVFTALCEDRPYRLGMTPEQAMYLIEDLAVKNALDKDIVAIASNYLGDLNDIRLGYQLRAKDDYITLRHVLV